MSEDRIQINTPASGRARDQLDKLAAIMGQTKRHVIEQALDSLYQSQTKRPDVDLWVSEEYTTVVSEMNDQDLDYLENAILIRRLEIMAQRLKIVGFSTRLSTQADGQTIYFRYILVYSPVNELHNQWATWWEARRLLDFARNLTPTEAFARWSKSVRPLAVEPYTEDQERQDIRAQRAELHRQIQAGEISPDAYADLYRATIR